MSPAVIEIPRDSVYITRNFNQGAVVRGYYSDFLRSRYWRAVRQRVLSLSSECERCGCRNHLQVHHTGYDCLGTETEYYKLHYLELLCESCHCEHHHLPAPERDHSGPELLSDIMRRMGFRDLRAA